MAEDRLPKDLQEVVLRERGMFADTALGDHETVQVELNQRGAEFTITCQGCGDPVGIGIPWFEIVALNYGVSPAAAYAQVPQVFGGQPPTPWVVVQLENGQREWRIRDFRCKRDNWHYPFHLSLSDPKRLLEKGRRIPGALPNEGQLSQIANAVAERMRAGGGPR